MPPGAGTRLVESKLVPPAGNPVDPTGVSGSNPVAGPGSEIVTSFCLIPFLPLRTQWVALITEFEWNHHFADVQKKGRFKSFYHRHELIAEGREGVNGTVVRDVIDYDIGFGWLGDLVQKLLIGRQLQRTFSYRQKALQRLS